MNLRQPDQADAAPIAGETIAAAIARDPGTQSRVDAMLAVLVPALEKQHRSIDAAGKQWLREYLQDSVIEFFDLRYAAADDAGRDETAVQNSSEHDAILPVLRWLERLSKALTAMRPETRATWMLRSDQSLPTALPKLYDAAYATLCSVGNARGRYSKERSYVAAAASALDNLSVAFKKVRPEILFDWDANFFFEWCAQYHGTIGGRAKTSAQDDLLVRVDSLLAAVKRTDARYTNVAGDDLRGRKKAKATRDTNESLPLRFAAWQSRNILLRLGLNCTTGKGSVWCTLAAGLYGEHADTFAACKALLHDSMSKNAR
jgi:hypothetical protein